jgi:single-stranded DNA-specific DHH superfamily exonuclease
MAVSPLKKVTPQGRRLLASYDTFMRGIKPHDRVALLHDKDPDGVSAGVIIARTLVRLRGRGPDLRLNAPRNVYSLTPEHVKTMRRKRISVLIVADISADHEPQLVRKVSRFARVILIDHHKLYTKFKERNILVIKPQLLQSRLEPAGWCTAKFAYDLGSRLVDLSDCDWLAATGSIADIATRQWKPWLAATMRRHKVKPNKDLFKTTFGRTAVTINNALVYSLGKMPQVFRICFNARKPDDVLRSPLRRYHGRIEREINKWVKQMPRKAEQWPERQLVIYTVTPDYNIKSTLSTILALKHPHTTLILLSRDGPLLSISARRNDKKVAMNNLLECAIAGIKGASAGGHIPAAGGRLPAKDVVRFKKQILHCLAIRR